ncbi:N-acetylneuraminate synthase [Synergistales bacterium]|nr:N-acetylneuraminate synthase [Synergistales bacterium]
MVRSGGTLVIAEAGVNYNGSLGMALDMISAAKEAGADVVKFQSGKPELVVSKFAPKAEYQKETTGGDESQLDMLKKLGPPRDIHGDLVAKCRELDIEFLSTPFDLPSVDLLVSLGVARLKIPSGEITNWPLIRLVGSTGKPAIMSTGMAALDEIRLALGVYLLGALLPETIPTDERVLDIYASREGRDYLKKNMTLLQCTTAYPTPPEDVNLLVMDTLAETFGLPVGLSDHTEGIEISLAAAARGAAIVEKHFTLDKNLPGPDHKASVTPEELRALVSGVRNINLALGKGEKSVAQSEAKNVAIARRSLVAAKPVKKGGVFTEENLLFKRPGTGIPPSKYWEYIGKIAERDYEEDELIDE